MFAFYLLPNLWLVYLYCSKRVVGTPVQVLLCCVHGQEKNSVLLMITYGLSLLCKWFPPLDVWQFCPLAWAMEESGLYEVSSWRSLGQLIHSKNPLLGAVVCVPVYGRSNIHCQIVLTMSEWGGTLKIVLPLPWNHPKCAKNKFNGSACLAFPYAEVTQSFTNLLVGANVICPGECERTIPFDLEVGEKWSVENGKMFQNIAQQNPSGPYSTWSR